MRSATSDWITPAALSCGKHRNKLCNRNLEWSAMEKSTVSGLIVAGATVVGAVVQVLVLGAVKRRKAKGVGPDRKRRMDEFDAAHGLDDPDAD